MNAADKIVNNGLPKKLIVIFFAMIAVFAVASFAVSWKIADISAKYQLEAYLSASGGGGITVEPTDEILSDGEEKVEVYGIGRDMELKSVFGWEKVRNTVFFSLFGISSAAALIWLIVSLHEFFKMYDEFEKLRSDCITSANTLKKAVSLYGGANDCLRRVSESARLLSERLIYMSRTLEADKVYLSEFLGDFSHQIKNALAVVRLNTDILSDSENMSEQRRNELVDEVQMNLDDMELLVVQAIKLARLEADTVAYNMESQPIADICRRAVKRITPVLRQKNIAFESELPEDITMMCDKSWLCEAVENIIKNSADHSGCTEITAKLEEDPARVKLTLSDNGAGIPQSDIPKLFERFAKRSSDITMKSAGLGLSIALKIIRQHGGDITVYSQEGEGTSFEIIFIKV